jgi:predicted dehydrogenase
LSKPVALLSGHPEKAKKVAEVYGINPDSIYGYEDYDKMADDTAIDIIYIILPNSLHADHTIRAAGAGKHVLCEKLMAVNVEECQRMIAAAAEAGRKLMIGYRLHYEPFNQKVMELCGKKALGKIKTICSSNCQNVKSPNIRLSRPLGGGPLCDIGIYCINPVRYITGEEPNEVTAIAQQPQDDPRFREVPESYAFTLRFPSGTLAHCDCSLGAGESRRYRVHCAEDFIELDPAFSYRGQQLHVKEAEMATGDARMTKALLEPVNHFSAKMDHFSDCVHMIESAALQENSVWPICA